MQAAEHVEQVGGGGDEAPSKIAVFQTARLSGKTENRIDSGLSSTLAQNNPQLTPINPDALR